MSDIILKSNFGSKSLSKSLSNNEREEMKTSNNLRYFNKRYEECFLEKELKNNLSRSTHFNNNYHISINNQIINGINQNRNIIIEEENNSIEVLELIYKNKIKFYEKIKELIIPKKIDNKEIKDEEEYIIEKIKKLITTKKDNIIIFDNQKLVFSHNQDLSIKSNINSNINETIIELDKIKIYKNSQEIKKEILEDRYNLNNIDNNIMDDIKMLKESINNSDKFLPETISPKNLYKIMMYCIKQFDYEKKMYIKFLNKEDLIILFKFATKFKKYISRVYSLLNNENKNNI